MILSGVNLAPRPDAYCGGGGGGGVPLGELLPGLLEFGLFGFGVPVGGFVLPVGG
jgi:hypothetical protein